MRKSTNTVFLLILALAFVLAACGGDEVSDPTATPVPTNTPIPPLAEAGPSSLDLDAPGVFQGFPGDYNVRMDFRFEGQETDGTDASGALLLLGANRADPLALSMDVTVSGVADLGGVDHVIYAELDGRIYFWNEINGCANLPSSTDQTTLFNSFVDTGSFLTGTAQRVQPDETINGVPSYHYALGPQNLDTADPASMEVTELTSGAIYVARDGGYVLRLVLQGIGTSDLLSAGAGPQGDISYQLDFEPAPNGVTITLPETCGESDTPQGDVPLADFPILDDATNVSAFAGFYSYQTETDLDTALDFYLTELAEEGWLLQQNNTIAGTAALMFSMGDRSLNVVIAPVGDTALSIIIAEEP